MVPPTPPPPSKWTFFSGIQSVWGSPKASHIKASQPHFPRFRVRIFRVFALWSLLRPLFFLGERDLAHFPHSPPTKESFEVISTSKGYFDFFGLF